MSNRKFDCFGFYEFYMIESIKFNLSQVEEAKTFLPSYKFLEDKLAEYEDNFVPAFARALRDYLWYASLGEARHSGAVCNGVIRSLKDGGHPNRTWSRGYVYRDIAEKYPPTPENVDMVLDLFNNYYWRGSYGGQRWGNITNAVQKYEEWDNVTFIDHCADLQHNNGVAFDKSGIPFWSNNGYQNLMNFLQFKFNANNLIADLRDLEKNIGWWKNILSRDILYILNKTYHITDTFPIQWELSGYERIPMNWRKYKYDLPWRYTSKDRSLGYLEPVPTCERCDATLGDDEIIEIDGYPHCSDCATECSNCFEPILVSGANADHFHDLYCDDCFEHFEECSQCGKHWDVDDLDGRGECPKCAEKRCDLCDTYDKNMKFYHASFIDNYPTGENDTLKSHKKRVCDSCMREMIIADYSVHEHKDEDIYTVAKSASVWDNPYMELLDLAYTKGSELTVYDLRPNLDLQESILASMKESELWVA